MDDVQAEANHELTEAVDRVRLAIRESDWARAGKISHALAGYFGSLGNTDEKRDHLRLEVRVKPTFEDCGHRLMHTDRSADVCTLKDGHEGAHAYGPGQPPAIRDTMASQLCRTCKTLLMTDASGAYCPGCTPR